MARPERVSEGLSKADGLHTLFVGMATKADHKRRSCMTDDDLIRLSLELRNLDAVLETVGKQPTAYIIPINYEWWKEEE